MSQDNKTKLIVAGAAIGSAAVAAALLYASKRRKKAEEPKVPPIPGTIPSGENPETD